MIVPKGKAKFFFCIGIMDMFIEISSLNDDCRVKSISTYSLSQISSCMYKGRVCRVDVYVQGECVHSGCV